MEFIRTNKTYQKYYDEFVVLLKTGMRVSEFCSLIKRDIDFEKRRIYVGHQLLRTRNRVYHIEKNQNHLRCSVYTHDQRGLRESQKNHYEKAQVKERSNYRWIHGFIMLDRSRNPKVALHIENEFRWVLKKYTNLYPDNPLPHITPHVYRHTFCTNIANAGMEVKALQYLMGHSDAGVTQNVYTHTSYDKAAEQMANVLPFEAFSERKSV